MSLKIQSFSTQLAVRVLRDRLLCSLFGFSLVVEFGSLWSLFLVQGMHNVVHYFLICFQVYASGMWCDGVFACDACITSYCHWQLIYQKKKD